MASQVVTIYSIGGKLADEIQTNLTRWSHARLAEDPSEWSPEQWPDSIRVEVDAFVERLLNFGFEPPVLYRSQHVDLWSMGDVFTRALGAAEVQLYTNRFEVLSTRYENVAKRPSSLHQFDEYEWLNNRICEAQTAWQELESRRIILIIRDILGGLWTDNEVEASLHSMPNWWMHG